MARKPKTLPPGWKGTGHLPITAAQIKAIHTLKGKLKMDDAAYVHVIARHGDGVMTSKDLTRRQASKVITELSNKLNGTTPQTPWTRTKAAKSKPAAQADLNAALHKLLDGDSAATPAPTPAPARGRGRPAKAVTTQGNVTALATPEQRALIGHLIAEVNWHKHGSYEAWLLKNQGIEKVVTKEQARNVIEGLKGLKKHGHAKHTE